MSDRWVCKRCFADNLDGDAACTRCGLARGAETTPAELAAWEPQHGVAEPATQPGWRRWARFWWVPALVVVVAVGYLTSARRDGGGALVAAGSVPVDDLQAGDCFNGGEEDEISEVDGVPCSDEHEYEVFALATYEGDGSFPTEADLEPIFFEVCEPSFEPYVGAPWEVSEIQGSMISPSDESWSAGDRSFICILYDLQDATLTESLAGSGR